MWPLGTGPRPVATCTGALHLSGDSTARPGAWATIQDYHQPGSAIAVRAGSDGSLQTATDSDRLGVGIGFFMCCVAIAAGLMELARLVAGRRGRRP